MSTVNGWTMRTRVSKSITAARSPAARRRMNPVAASCAAPSAPSMLPLVSRTIATVSGIPLCAKKVTACGRPSSRTMKSCLSRFATYRCARSVTVTFSVMRSTPLRKGRGGAGRSGAWPESPCVASIPSTTARKTRPIPVLLRRAIARQASLTVRLATAVADTPVPHPQQHRSRRLSAARREVGVIRDPRARQRLRVGPRGAPLRDGPIGCCNGVMLARYVTAYRPVGPSAAHRDGLHAPLDRGRSRRRREPSR